jgi:hypothetical protein
LLQNRKKYLNHYRNIKNIEIFIHSYWLQSNIEQVGVWCNQYHNNSVARDYRENIIAKTNTANTFIANVDNREIEYSECRLQRMQIPRM